MRRALGCAASAARARTARGLAARVMAEAGEVLSRGGDVSTSSATPPPPPAVRRVPPGGPPRRVVPSDSGALPSAQPRAAAPTPWGSRAASAGLTATRESVTGTVTNITFGPTEDTGYTVATLRLKPPSGERKEVKVVGDKMPGLAKGKVVKVTGAWVKDAKYGMQLSVDCCEEVPPEGKEGVLEYLSGGVVPGVGPATAKKLVDRFGEDTLAVIAAPDGASRMTAVLGVSKAGKVKLAWDEGAGERNTLEFLVSLGLPQRLAQRAVEAHGVGNVQARVRENPFEALSRVRGASFATVDALAVSLGVGAAHPARVRAGLLDALVNRAGSDGHAFLPWRDALKHALKTLCQPRTQADEQQAALIASAEQDGTNQWASADARDQDTRALPDATHVERAVHELVASGQLILEQPELPSPSDDQHQAMAQHRPEEDEHAGSLHLAARLYVPDLHEAESIVAAALAQRCSDKRLWQVPSNLVDWLRLSEKNLDVQLSTEQREAVAAAATQRVLILTGGPGTGKTFVMALAVRLWLQQKRRVRLCAPTGRAAQRMAELIADVAEHAPELRSLEPPSTIHRLLEYIPRGPVGAAASGAAPSSDSTDDSTLSWSGRFKRDESNPLDVDALVVDEASMLDLPLAAALLRALPPDATLLIIGDPDQLPPVGPGSPLRDALRSGIVPAARLSALFRQGKGSLIAKAAMAVHHGVFPPLAPVTLQEGSPENGLLNSGALLNLKQRLGFDPHAQGFSARAATPAAAATALSAGCDALWVRLADDSGVYAAHDALEHLISTTLPQAGFDASRDLQVLIPMRKGPAGSAALCTVLAPMMNPRGGPAQRTLKVRNTEFAIGDRVLQMANDYDKEVFNGDLGTVRHLDTMKRELVVTFGDGKDVRYEGPQMDALAPAWAVTVHKAQGCEFPVVALVLDKAHSRMLQRHLLYTALSRASKLLVVVSADGPLAAAVRNVVTEKRNSHLVPRLLALAQQHSPGTRRSR